MANQSAFAILIVLFVCAWVGRFLLQVRGNCEEATFAAPLPDRRAPHARPGVRRP
jgi:hypothetical protein